MKPGIDLILLESTAEISLNAKALLNIESGDRVNIEYINDGTLLLPILVKSDDGKLLTKSNTFIFRGKQRELLKQYGTEFIVEQRGNKLVLKGNGDVIYTSVKEAVEQKKRYLSEDILKDTNYNIQKFDTYIL